MTHFVIAGLEAGSPHIGQVAAVTGAGQGPVARADVDTVDEPLPKQKKTAAPKVAVITPVATAGPTARVSDATKVSGSLVMSTTVSTSIQNSPNCSGNKYGLRLIVKDGSSSTVALAKFGPGHVSDVKRDHGILGYDCNWRYSASLSLASPVYTFRAYYEGLEDTIEPDESTKSSGDLAGGEGPNLYLSFCPECSH